MSILLSFIIERLYDNKGKHKVSESSSRFKFCFGINYEIQFI